MAGNAPAGPDVSPAPLSVIAYPLDTLHTSCGWSAAGICVPPQRMIDAELNLFGAIVRMQAEPTLHMARHHCRYHLAGGGPTSPAGQSMLGT